MKRFFTFLLALFPLISIAEEVPLNKAKAVAETFLMSDPQTRSTQSKLDLELVWDGIISTKATTKAPSFYLFNNRAGKGYVLVSGDDSLFPILGYSFASNASSPEFMPSNFRAWLEFLNDEITWAQANAIVPTAAVSRAWNELENPRTASYNYGNVLKKHETASWDQMAPYNLECPQYSGKKAASGCVITAVSIVMRFHKWPDCGVGKTDAYTTNTRKLKVPSRTLGEKYDWDRMPMFYDSKRYKEDEARQVARLMAEVGAAVSADYFIDRDGSTGAYSDDIPKALTKYFKYDKSIYLAARDDYSTAQWNRMMKAELDKAPLVYGGGTKNNEGHAFVIDGYTDKNYFSVNWGWGGYQNGYFLLSALDPDDQGTGGAASGNGFNYGQDAIMNMAKDHGGEPKQLIIMSSYYDDTNPKDVWDYKGLEASNTELSIGQEFRIKAGVFFNAGTLPFEGELAVALCDKMGELKEVLYSENLEGNDNLPVEYMTAFASQQVKINSPFNTGDMIRCYYKPKGTGEYIMIQGNTDEGVIIELPLKLKQVYRPLRDCVILQYDKQSSKLILDYEEGIHIEFTQIDGTKLSESLFEKKEGRIILDSSTLSGKYLLKLSREKENESITIKF